MMQIFRVHATQEHIIETLVIAKDINDARMRTLMAIKNGELDFIDTTEEPAYISLANPINAEEDIIKEVKNYGILDENLYVVYDGSIIKELKERMKKAEKEAYLKKHHMEFNFEEKI